ncbi:hypothetical protein BHE90_006338 [Fusarium euwallaceae]|uniref:Cellobiose dehydrogenase cytochrome domain-containing protein n=1 Tax=Fusarium euwallaceae TaxID=1147111 RepID=A0A430LTY2_9HYPO|nr:hypothetical protein BHE90_006338 [Fusarium euwallaceae]
MRLTSFLSFVVLAIEPCFTTAQRLGTPSYEFLYTVNASLGERWPVGDYGQGSRVVIPITGGTFNGPRLSGTINNLGADWGLTDSKGVFFPDTRYNLRTHDGADIFIQTAGPTQPDGRTLLRGIFQTGHPDYEWLNYIVAIGVLQRPTGDHKGKYVLVDMWQVVLPCQGSECEGLPQSGTVEQPMEPWMMQGV